MSEIVAVLEAVEKPLLVLLGAVAGGLMGPLTDRLRARTTAAWWEAQERWRFKAQLYTRSLTTLKRMRLPLEVAATKGVWPDQAVWDEIKSASRELIEPSVVGRIWLTKGAVEPLETLGTRILDLARQRAGLGDKKVLMNLCEIIEADIGALQTVAQKDLRLRLGSDM